MLLLWIR